MYWSMIDNFIYISIFFAIAIILKRFLPFLRKFIIPNAILAGFMGQIYLRLFPWITKNSDRPYII
ncbi:MAG: glutamate:Na+ symporter, family [Kosmotoga sp.]|nr:glutamate:Na+ symporter, family [Kosmotoga sp.]